MDIFGGGHSSLVGGSVILPATSVILHPMNLGAQEVCRGGHLLKSRGEAIHTLLLKYGDSGSYNGLTQLPS